MRWVLFALLVAAIGLSSSVNAVDDPLVRARTLYEQAAYEDALDLLDRFERGGTADAATISRIREYRSLCLIALNRPDEAEAVLTLMVGANPLYAPSFKDPSPRFASAVQKVRSQIVPLTVQRLYTEAKAAASRRRFNEATVALERLLRVAQQDGLERAVVTSLQEEVRDARELLDVSRRSPTVYTTGDPGITPPVVIRQMLPDPRPVSTRITRQYSGELELIVDTKGTVESARLATPVHPDYDPLLLKAAKAWTYKPAQQSGRPVPWRTVIAIHLTPGQ
jgi:outer membrane biosynthesis protein TonB